MEKSAALEPEATQEVSFSFSQKDATVTDCLAVDVVNAFAKRWERNNPQFSVVDSHLSENEDTTKLTLTYTEKSQK